MVGFGIAGAMAARVGFPNQAVILLTGDGSATFSIGDIECAARQYLPFVIIVADDEAWGIVVSAHTRRYGRPSPASLVRFGLTLSPKGSAHEAFVWCMLTSFHPPFAKDSRLRSPPSSMCRLREACPASKQRTARDVHCALCPIYAIGVHYTAAGCSLAARRPPSTLGSRCWFISGCNLL